MKEQIISYILTFAVGGAICALGQLLIDRTKLTPARILVIFVVAGVGLTGLGLWDWVVELAGAGATVPIVGFGYSLAKGVEKAIDMEGALGILTGGLKGTAAGIAAAVVFGYLASLVSRSKMK